MATSQTPTLLPQDEERRQSQEFNELLSSLPRVDGAAAMPVYRYRGFWYSERFLLGMLASQQHVKETDVILASSPKAGTTWLKALAFAVANRSCFPDLQHHPLLTNNPHKLVPCLEELYVDNQIPHLISPAIIATHMPYSMLPKSINDSNCKIVYITRDPKDLFVSYWHFVTGFTEKNRGASIPLQDMFELFCAGVSNFGAFWDHVMEYWKASLEKPLKVRFLKYEDLQRNPMLQLKGLADFLGYSFTPKEDEDGLAEDILNLCSFKNLSNLEVNKMAALQVFLPKRSPLEINHSLFFRRGEVGDWTNYLTNQMAERLDRITNERFQGLGLTFQASH